MIRSAAPLPCSRMFPNVGRWLCVPRFRVVCLFQAFFLLRLNQSFLCTLWGAVSKVRTIPNLMGAGEPLDRSFARVRELSTRALGRFSEAESTLGALWSTILILGRETADPRATRHNERGTAIRGKTGIEKTEKSSAERHFSRHSIFLTVRCSDTRERGTIDAGEEEGFASFQCAEANFSGVKIMEPPPETRPVGGRLC